MILVFFVHSRRWQSYPNLCSVRTDVCVSKNISYRSSEDFSVHANQQVLHLFYICLLNVVCDTFVII